MLIAAIAATLLLPGLPAGSAAAATHSSAAAHRGGMHPGDARWHFVAGSRSRRVAGVTWHADDSLHAGGTLRPAPTELTGNARRLNGIARTAPREYDVHVNRPGIYRVTFHYVVCDGDACHVRAGDKQLRISDRLLRVRPSRTIGRHGVTNLVVTRLRSSALGATLQPSSGIFGKKSIWKTPIDQARLDPRSRPMVKYLTKQVAAYYGGTAAFNAYQYNVSWYAVKADQAESRIKFSNCQSKSWIPQGLYGPQGQFTHVPIPRRALPSVGTDATIAIYRPKTDQLWELWRASHDRSGWHACWGGRLDNVSKSLGYFAGGFGASATSLAGEGGDVTIKDVRRGKIDHALSLAIPGPAIFTNYRWPAQRSDGGNPDRNAVPEGARLRLSPHVKLRKLHLTPIALMIAKAARKYGFVVTNRSGCVTVTAESGAPAQVASGTNPWSHLLAGVPTYQVLKNFPWSHLQVVRANFGRPR